MIGTKHTNIPWVSHPWREVRYTSVTPSVLPSMLHAADSYHHWLDHLTKRETGTSLLLSTVWQTIWRPLLIHIFLWICEVFCFTRVEITYQGGSLQPCVKEKKKRSIWGVNLRQNRRQFSELKISWTTNVCWVVVWRCWILSIQEFMAF